LSLIPLPIDPLLGDIVDRVRESRAVVVTAAPGAGKTTRVPPALLADGPVILLQPRRAAARAIAARIADEHGWTLGRTIGWQVRFDRKFGSETRLLVVTEGVLTARLQTDPLLSGFTTIILDEFHERSVHADLAIALSRQAWRARDDLRLVVMSATLDAVPVSAFLDGCPVIDVPGRTFPLEVSYRPGQSVADAAIEMLDATAGQVLCFLPGAPEIRRAIGDLQSRTRGNVDVVPLHGSLDAAEQDLALRPSHNRRVIVATNIAETSLTVPGVTAVVDGGLQKVARYDAARGIDSLETERITMDAADQRAGRAGRLAPGVVRRLWDSRDRLRPHREPEIERIDLSSTVLDVIAWGGDPRTLEWFERPREERIGAALSLLARLGLIDGRGRLTAVGDQVRRLPVHPRLAAMLVAAGGAQSMARACALLSERYFLAPRAASTSSDLLSALDDWTSVPPHVQLVAAQLSNLGLRASGLSEPAFRRAVLAGYPDRVAQRRQAGSSELLLATGTGATLGSESGVRSGEFLVALEIARVPPSAHLPQFPRVRIASAIDRDWLDPTSSTIEHRFDTAAGRVRAARIDRYDALTLAEHSVPVDPEIAAQLLADAWLERGPDDRDALLMRRLRFIGREIDVQALALTASYGARSLDDVRIESALTPDLIRALAIDAPESLGVPSGRHTALSYNDDGSVSASVKLQELFGLAETPRVGRQREPVVLSLLAPNGRPVQVTRDLRSFWDRTYPEVRKELRGRYPKHPWPEDPWTAPPTARTKRRQG
jgi:ATP-dependent RNA helicase HrpB